MCLAVVFYFLITLHTDNRTIVQCELIFGIFKIDVLDQNTLKIFRIEAERRTALESLIVGVHIDILEFLKRKIRWHISRF